MKRMRLACVALAASALLLASCAPAAELPPAMTTEQRQAMVVKLLDEQWQHISREFPDAERPAAEVVRFVEEDEEWFPVFEQCLRERGAELTGEWSAEQAVAQMACEYAYPPPWSVEFALSEEERSFLHNYAVNVLTPCVRSFGFEVPPMPAPDESMAPYADHRIPLYPVLYGDSARDRLTILRLESVLAKCPEYPAGWHER